MFSNLISWPPAAIKIGLKPIKSFIDSHFRPKVIPVAGSVVYCDLWVAADHSGIYVQNGQISNIVVTRLAAPRSEVKWSDARDFTSKSKLGRKIYVSSRSNYAIGDDAVAEGAAMHIGEESFYGLLIKNCHQFSSKCVDYSGIETSMLQDTWSKIKSFASLDWEPTISELKRNAENKLGATKWLLWDWNNEAENEPEPDWQQQNDFFKNQALTPEFIQYLRQEWAETQNYQKEISDEDIPAEVLGKLKVFEQTLNKISDKYEEVKDFLKRCPEAQLSYNDLEACRINFTDLARELEKNRQIKELVRKMGRAYLSEELKKRHKVPEASRNEVHGTHRSDDLMRLLPSEMVNLDNEDLEMLFYSRLLEKNLIAYELQGITTHEQEDTEEQQKRTGPIVACLDTSASMNGAPLQKARALLFAVSTILKREQRSLHVLLFGENGQIQEFSMENGQQTGGLMRFLSQGFNGGTDFETPLNRALEIIESQENFMKADILMLSDGDCMMSEGFAKTFKQRKQKADCMVYSVLCNGQHTADDFSDEITVL